MPTVGDRFISRVITGVEDQSGINVRMWRVSAVVGVGLSWLQVAAQLETALAPLYKNWLPVGASWLGVEVQAYSPLLLQTVNSVAAAGPGTVAGEVAPRQVSGLVTHTTARAGRKYRGRTYVPFVPVSAVVPPDTLTVASVALLNTIGSYYHQSHNLASGADSVTIDPIIEHRPLGAVGFEPITGGAARSVLATQRRRGPFGRKNF
jgi:hypothetical protein